jgi:nucleoside-diphosphate-sugar epimerase
VNFNNRRILITGGNGFIGSALRSHLAICKRPYLAISRSEKANVENDPNCRYCDLKRDSLPLDLFSSSDAIIHCAGRAHISHTETQDSERYYREVNVELTEALARRAVAAGVRRFIFLSSIGVYGEHGGSISQLNEETLAMPVTAYGKSKLEAERRLNNVSRETGLEIVIVRPCLVAGPGAPGNLRRLKRLIESTTMLPVPTKKNQRSFVGISNLVELLILCIDHDNAPGQIFVAADSELVSTIEVMKSIAKGAGVAFRPIGLPNSLIKLGATIAGKRNIYRKLFENLSVDSSKAQIMLGWKPMISTLESMYQLGAYDNKMVEINTVGRN